MLSARGVHSLVTRSESVPCSAFASSPAGGDGRCSDNVFQTPCVPQPHAHSAEGVSSGAGQQCAPLAIESALASLPSPPKPGAGDAVVQVTKPVVHQSAILACYFGSTRLLSPAFRVPKARQVAKPYTIVARGHWRRRGVALELPYDATLRPPPAPDRLAHR